MQRLRNILLILILVLLPVVAWGKVTNPPNPPPSDVPKIDNPLKAKDLSALLIDIAEEAAKIGFYVVVFFIIWSGFLFVSARGDETKLKDARKTFLYTVIGAAILLGAVVLANVIKGTVDKLETRDSTHQSVIV